MLRQTLRGLRNSPGFTAAAVLLLALGIGGAVAVFSAFDAILMRRLPVRDPDSLAVVLTYRHNAPPMGDYPWYVFDSWRLATSAFSGTFAQYDLEVSLNDGDAVRLGRAEIVTGDYFTVLGVQPAIGRLLAGNDEWASADGMSAVLGFDYWSREYGRDPAVLGRSIRLNDRPFTIVGVTPENFNGIAADTGPDVRVPFIAAGFLTEDGIAKNDPRRCCEWQIAGRLRPGVSPERARQEMPRAFLAGWTRQRPVTADDLHWIRDQDFRVERIGRGMSWVRDRFSAGLSALMGATVLVLLLCCSNVAGLLIARVAERRQDTAVRLALGATRAQLLRQWMAECAALALLGAAGGIAVAAVCLPLFGRVVPAMRNLMTERLPVRIHAALDWRVLAFAIAVCCLACLLSGLGPAISASGTDLVSGLKAGASDFRRVRFRAALVAAQAATCTTVLGVAGLMLETLRHLDTLDPGFDRHRLVTFSLDTSLVKYTAAERSALASRLLAEVRRLPETASAAIALKAVMRGSGLKVTIGTPGLRSEARQDLNASLNVVSPEYFETMRIPLLAGRLFDARDAQAAKPPPTIVNRTLAARFFPRGDAVGQFIGTPGPDGTFIARGRIVGVVGDTKYRSLREPFQPVEFSCLIDGAGLSNAFFEVEVRTRGEPEAVIAPVQRILRSIDARLPFREIRTIREDIADSLWAERAMAGLGSVFAGLSAVLTAIGIFGLLSWSLTQRTREIGIRMAVGAKPSDIVGLAMRRTLILTACAVAAGAAGSLIAGRLLRSLLYDASPYDPSAVLASAALVIAISAFATFLPAVRASRLDPSKTLRY